MSTRQVKTAKWPRSSFDKTVVSKLDATIRFRREHPDLVVRSVMRFKALQQTNEILLQVEVEDREKE